MQYIVIDFIYTHAHVRMRVFVGLCTSSNSYFTLLGSQLWLCGGPRALEPIPGICCRQQRVEADWSELVGWFIARREHWNASCALWPWPQCSRCGGKLYWFGVRAHNEVAVQLIWTLVVEMLQVASQPPRLVLRGKFTSVRIIQERVSMFNIEWW